MPVGLLEGGKVIAPVKKGELLTTANAAPDPTTRLFALRQRQDQMLNGGSVIAFLPFLCRVQGGDRPRRRARPRATSPIRSNAGGPR